MAKVEYKGLDMDALDGILRTEVLASILIMASFGLVLRSVLQFVPQKGEMQPKLAKTETELAKFRKYAEPRHKSVQELLGKVERMKALEEEMQEYWTELNEVLSAGMVAEENAQNIKIHEIRR